MTKALVTGAGGFVGANVVESLTRRGVECLGFDVRKGMLDSTVPFVEGDILSADDLDRALDGIDVIVHLAVSNLRTSIENPGLNVRVNVEGTTNLLEGAKGHDVRKVIYPSASSIYGVPQYTPVDERHPTLPATVYGVTKYTGEHLVRVYQEMYGIDYFVFRFANVFGPKQHPSTGGLVPTLLTRMHQGLPVTVYGDGMQTRDFVFVEDVAHFVARAVEEPDKANETVNLGSGVQTPVIDVINACAETLGIDPTIEYKQQESGERMGFQADTSLCRDLFDEVPSTPLLEGLRTTVEWFRSGVWNEESG